MRLRNRILLVTISINIIAITCIYLIARTNASNAVKSITTEQTINLLRSAMLTIENQYTSLEFQRRYTSSMRKKERQQIVKMAKSILWQYFNDFNQGILSEAEAKSKALRKISAFRYDDGNGYIWINDTMKPIPGIIMHPIYSQFNGKLSDDPVFFTSEDSVNVPRLALDKCEKQGGGFIEYMWKKPQNLNTSSVKPKTSYVELFEPWQWILGTGVYLDDIENDVENRLNAVIEELKQTMGKIKLGETGYFFIFNSKHEFILHPIFNQNVSDSVADLLLQDAPFTEVMNAANTEQKSYEYTWYSPLDNESTKTHRKKVFVEYFEPLDWYVCASFYESELKEPGIVLGRKILFISTIFLLISILAIIYLSKSITRPLNELIHFVSGITGGFEDLKPDKIPTFKSFEANALGRVITDMLSSIRDQQQSLVKEKARAQESEALMRDSEKKYRTLYESSNDAIFLIKENRIISCNQQTMELFHSAEDELIGFAPSELSPEFQENGQKSADMEREILQDVLNGEARFFEWRHIRPIGEIIDCSVSLNLVELNNEKYVQSTIRDITARKKNEKELEVYRNQLEKLVESRTQELNEVNETLYNTNNELSEKNELIVKQNDSLLKALQNLKETQSQLVQSEKMASLGILTAGVAHEINNPINYIHNGAEALRASFEIDQVKDKQKYEKFFEVIFEGVKRITEIVRSLGKYSWSQEGNYTQCSVHEIIDNCLRMLRNQYKSRIQIERKYVSDLPAIKANEGELHQVFLNLLSNAIQAITHKGEIKIETYIEDQELYIRISDNGKGIEKEIQDHIFDPFFTTKDPGIGTGLGLSITKKLLESHKGKVNFNSISGKGSSFIVSLPLS